MANYELIGLDEATPQLLAPTASDTGVVSNLTVTTNITASDGTANGVVYLDGSKVQKSDSNLTYDGTDLALGGHNVVTEGTISTTTNPLAKAVRVAMTAASSGSNGIQVADDVNLNIGVSDATLRIKGALPDYSPNATIWLWYKYQDADNRFGVYLHSSGELRFYSKVGGIEAITGSCGVPLSSINLIDGECVVFDCVIARESPSSAGSITFYVNNSQIGVSTVIASGVPVDISNTGSVYILGDNAQRFESVTQEAITYNRALSATEVLDLCINGPALADIGASQVPVYESDFSSGVDGFAIVSGLSSLASVGGSLETVSSGGNGLATKEFAFEFGKTYELVFEVDGISLASGSVRVGAINSGFTTIDGGVGDILSTGVYKTPAFVATTAIKLFVQFLGETSGDSVSFSNITAKRVGVTGHWNAEDCQGDTGQIFDRSGNGNHAKLPASGAKRIPEKREFEIRWTNTWAGTHEAQYISGVNEALLNANAYITSIVGKVSGASGQNIIVGDGSDTDKFVASVALANGTQVFTVASATNDGTNRKMVADPSANFTGSISWTIRGYILEV